MLTFSARSIGLCPELAIDLAFWPELEKHEAAYANFVAGLCRTEISDQQFADETFNDSKFQNSSRCRAGSSELTAGKFVDIKQFRARL